MGARREEYVAEDPLAVLGLIRLVGGSRFAWARDAVLVEPGDERLARDAE